MKIYWNAPAICKRMGWGSTNTLTLQVINNFFPAYKTRHGSHGRLVWHTTESLITLWQLGKCQATRNKMIVKAKRTQERRLVKEALREQASRWQAKPSDNVLGDTSHQWKGGVTEGVHPKRESSKASRDQGATS